MSSSPAQTLSLLGDSISTFLGATPEDGCYYAPGMGGLRSVADTWWMLLARALGARVLVNNSYAGSTLSYGGPCPACYPGRMNALEAGGESPDRILIYTGLNDLACGISPLAFSRDAAALLNHLARRYPQAEVYLATLPRPLPPEAQRSLFLPPGLLAQRETYNELLRRAAGQNPGHLADLAALDCPYATMDGVHPNRSGMETLARLWQRCL